LLFGCFIRHESSSAVSTGPEASTFIYSFHLSLYSSTPLTVCRLLSSLTAIASWLRWSQPLPACLRPPPPSRPTLPEIQMSSTFTLGHRHWRNEEAITRLSTAPGRPQHSAARLPRHPSAACAYPRSRRQPRRRMWMECCGDGGREGRSREPSAGGGMGLTTAGDRTTPMPFRKWWR
jgi:hypothetical protein